MEQMVPNVEKKTFLKWLLDRREMQNRETFWLLNYMRSDENMLNLLHFVDNVAGCNRSLTIYEKKRSFADFEYVKNKVPTNDPEKAFHDLRLNQDEPVFVKIHLSSDKYSPEYLSILEDNPALAEQIHETYGNAADIIAEEAEKRHFEMSLYQKINHALDEGDAETFYSLTKKLNQIKSENPTKDKISHGDVR